MKKVLMVPVALVLLVACGDPDAARQNGSAATEAIPPVLKVICHEDGGTELLNAEVAASEDGVHVEVDNRAGEFVSLNGIGLDFSEGITEEAADVPPGDSKIACWPGSMHSGPEPKLLPLTIRDPQNYYVEGDLECPPDTMVESTINDFMSDAVGEQGDPSELAREHAQLEETDEVVTLGYQNKSEPSVGVRREGKIIASIHFIPTKDGGWLLSSYEACSDSRLRIE